MTIDKNVWLYIRNLFVKYPAKEIQLSSHNNRAEITLIIYVHITTNTQTASECNYKDAIKYLHPVIHPPPWNNVTLSLFIIKVSAFSKITKITDWIGNCIAWQSKVPKLGSLNSAETNILLVTINVYFGSLPKTLFTWNKKKKRYKSLIYISILLMYAETFNNVEMT